MFKKITALFLILVFTLTGCNNSSQDIDYSDNSVISNPFDESVSDVFESAVKPVGFEVGVKSEEAIFADNNILQIPLILNGDEGCEAVGIKVFIDGLLQEFSADNSDNYSFWEKLSVKTDDTDYALKIKAKFDENIETHTISAVSIYNPDFVPHAGMSLGNNHKAAAGAFQTLPISGVQPDFSDNTAICNAENPSAITNEQSEKYNLKGEYDEALLLLQNGGNTYTLNETDSSVLLQFVAGTQVAGSEKYRVSFYKNHELAEFNGGFSYIDISLEGGKISITDIEITDVKDGDFLYCIAVPTSSYNEFAYPKKTDTVVVTKGE